MGPKTVEQYLIEKLEELPDAIQHILYEHGDQVAVAKELLEGGNTSEACGAGSVRISVSGEVIPGAAQRGCPFLFVM